MWQAGVHGKNRRRRVCRLKTLPWKWVLMSPHDVSVLVFQTWNNRDTTFLWICLTEQQPTSLTGEGAVLVSQGSNQCWRSSGFTCTCSRGVHAHKASTLQTCVRGPWSFSSEQSDVRQSLSRFPAGRRREKKDKWWEKREGGQLPWDGGGAAERRRSWRGDMLFQSGGAIHPRLSNMDDLGTTGVRVTKTFREINSQKTLGSMFQCDNKTVWKPQRLSAASERPSGHQENQPEFKNDPERHVTEVLSGCFLTFVAETCQTGGLLLSERISTGWDGLKLVHNSTELHYGRCRS